MMQFVGLYWRSAYAAHMPIAGGGTTDDATGGLANCWSTSDTSGARWALAMCSSLRSSTNFNWLGHSSELNGSRLNRLWWVLVTAVSEWPGWAAAWSVVRSRSNKVATVRRKLCDVTHSKPVSVVASRHWRRKLFGARNEPASERNTGSPGATRRSASSGS